MIKEEDLVQTCPYCNNNIEVRKWDIQLDANEQYGNFRCECGKSLRIKLQRLFDAAKDWKERMDICMTNPKIAGENKKEKIVTLENRIQVVKEYKSYTLK